MGCPRLPPSPLHLPFRRVLQASTGTFNIFFTLPPPPPPLSRRYGTRAAETGMPTRRPQAPTMLQPSPCCRCGRRFVAWRDERRERLQSYSTDDKEGDDDRRKDKKKRRRKKKRAPTATDSEDRRVHSSWWEVVVLVGGAGHVSICELPRSADGASARRASTAVAPKGLTTPAALTPHGVNTPPRRSSVVSVSGVGVQGAEEDDEGTETDTDDDHIKNGQSADMWTLEEAEEG